MNLKEYFETNRGLGVLSTADADGQVDAAVYARPHVLDDGQVALLMAEKRTHANLQNNPRACYLFRQDAPGYRGMRLTLTKVSETDDPAAADALRRENVPDHCKPAPGEKRFVVTFRVDEQRPLVGDG
jgi:hypothetical protein